LLATATVTSRAGLRSSKHRTQAPVADVLLSARRITDDQKPAQVTIGRCQSKIEYSARAPDSNFATVDFHRFFRPDPDGSTAISSIQNFALTMPARGADDHLAA
jgi:hypothetical protein